MESEQSALFYGLVSLPDQRLAPRHATSHRDEARAVFDEAAAELMSLDLAYVAVPQDAFDELAELMGGA